MKKIILTVTSIILLNVVSYSQEGVQSQGSKSIAQAALVEKQLKEDKRIQKEIAKAEKDRKRAEKEAKKSERLAKDIDNKRRSIDKGESKIAKLQNKLTKGKSKGKLSPVDEMTLNQKIEKLKIDIAKEREKLAKLERKQ
ncbi:MAG: hypothetical protein E4H26_09550 [Flavobacteriales bacterium]|nr:MAG: hypothetical protein E4H26_09550 [Flavobacteriales bacterium]